MEYVERGPTLTPWNETRARGVQTCCWRRDEKYGRKIIRRWLLVDMEPGKKYPAFEKLFPTIKKSLMLITPRSFLGLFNLHFKTGPKQFPFGKDWS